MFIKHSKPKTKIFFFNVALKHLRSLYFGRFEQLSSTKAEELCCC